MATTIQARVEVDYVLSALLTIENLDTGLEPPTYRATLDCYRERSKVTTEFQSPIATRLDLIGAAFIAIAETARKEGLV
jgi:hypothetical protein